MVKQVSPYQLQKTLGSLATKGRISVGDVKEIIGRATGLKAGDWRYKRLIEEDLPKASRSLPASQKQAYHKLRYGRDSYKMTTKQATELLGKTIGTVVEDSKRPGSIFEVPYSTVSNPNKALRVAVRENLKERKKVAMEITEDRQKVEKPEKSIREKVREYLQDKSESEGQRRSTGESKKASDLTVPIAPTPNTRAGKAKKALPVEDSISISSSQQRIKPQEKGQANEKPSIEIPKASEAEDPFGPDLEE